MMSYAVLLVLFLAIGGSLAMLPPSTLGLFPLVLRPKAAAESFLTLARLVANMTLAGVPRVGESCQEAMLAALSNPFGTSVSTNLIMLSGKKMNDLGDYEACKKATGSYYVLMTLAAGLSVSYGACLPKACKIKDLDALKPMLKSMMKSASPLPLTTELDIQFYNLKKTNAKFAKPTFGYTLVLLISAGLLGVILFATVVEYLAGSPNAPPMKVLNCFSLIKNIKSLYNTENKLDPNLEVLNGIRVLSMVWIILGHAYSLEVTSRLYNITDLTDSLINDFSMVFVKLGTLAVDVFFFLSGFLAALQFSKVFEHGAGVGAVLLCFLKRYIRLLPIHGLAILYIIYLQVTVKDEPFMAEVMQFKKTCEDKWYHNLLYVSNFMSGMNTCVPWSWYIMNDMQFYILAPLFVLPFYYFSQIVGLLTLGALAVASIVTQCAIMFANDLNSSVSKPSGGDYGTLYYVKPYCRVLPYLVGILLYFVYSEYKKKEDESAPSSPLRKVALAISNKPSLHYVLYILGIGLLLHPIYPKYFLDTSPNSWGQGFATFQEISYRPLFVLGISCIILPTLLGKGTVIGVILGHRVFNPISKVTYALYMMHPMLLMFRLFYTMNGHCFANLQVMGMFFDTLFAGLLLSFLVTLVYESPVMQLMRLFCDSRAPAKEKEIEEKTEPMLAGETKAATAAGEQ